jgi:hypothetical protein
MFLQTVIGILEDENQHVTKPLPVHQNTVYLNVDSAHNKRETFIFLDMHKFLDCVSNIWLCVKLSNMELSTWVTLNSQATDLWLDGISL